MLQRKGSRNEVIIEGTASAENGTIFITVDRY
jgi:hypothetical protein